MKKKYKITYQIINEVYVEYYYLDEEELKRVKANDNYTVEEVE